MNIDIQHKDTTT